MFTFVTNIPISRRLSYAFLLAALIPGIVISGLGIAFINTQIARSQVIQTNIRMTKDTTNASLSLQRSMDLLNVAVEQYKAQGANSQTRKLLDTIVSNETIFETTLRQYPQLYQLASAPQMNDTRNMLLADNPDATTVNDQKVAINQVETLWSQYKGAQEQVIKGIKNNANIDALTTQANAKYIPVQKTWARIAQIADQVNNSVAQVGDSQTNTTIIATIIAFLSTILVVITIGYAVNLTITRPLRELTRLTRRIARGETEARAKILGHDEIYTVATSMNNMLDNIVQLIQETQAQRDVLQGRVEKLVSEVSGVGEGDLRVQAEVTADALGVLADSFNYMVEELGSLVIRVKMVAHDVENSTATVLDRMTQLVETGDTQIKQISGAAAEIEQTAESSREVAGRSQRLYDVARIARQDAQIGRASVQQAVEGMGRINENVQATATKVQTLGDRSREINEIVEAISGIAHQTNRLALDAAIQAAMAGENGKGFGAVAADIRRLAERAKDQAGMITHIVRSVREDIGAAAISMQDTERETAAGTRLTQEAGIALESIFAAVEHQAREIEIINQAAMRQLNSASAVVQIMHELSASTQQSGFSTRNASQNMERLTRLVEQLRASVEAFKMRENQGYFANKTSVNEEETDTPLTFSSIFRTVSATAQSSPSAQPSRIAATKIYEAPIDQVSEHPAWDWGNASTQSGQQWYILGKQPENGNNSW